MLVINSSNASLSVCTEKNELSDIGKILTTYIQKSTGISIPSASRKNENQFVLDILPLKTELPHKLFLKKDDYVIFEKENNVYLYSGSLTSLKYAVYDFLETFFDCVFTSSDSEYIPKKSSVVINDDFYKYEYPKFLYREVYYRNAFNDNFAAKLKLNGDCNNPGAPKKWGLFCHSFFTIIPPDKYFSSNPEYFSQHNGKRVNSSQLCCSNDNMINEAIKNLIVLMSQNPEAEYWSVSQNDGGAPCECEKCKKLDEEAGSHIGSIAYFVNKIAEAFPNKTISTLAYWYSRTAPKKLKLRNNVSILLCSLEVNRSKPINQDSLSKSFYYDLSEWRKITDNIFIWDYCIQFSNLIAPFPNLDILAPNLRFFHETDVKYMFAQGNREKVGELSALRAYLLAKLLWNPYCDIEYHKNKFLYAYYGDAGKYISEYINLLHKNLKKNNESLSIYGKPEKELFLSKECLDEYSAILENAKKSVINQPLYLSKTEEIILNILYVRIKTKRYDKKDELKIFSEFKRIANNCGCEKVDEVRITLDMFINGFETGNPPEDTIYAF